MDENGGVWTLDAETVRTMRRLASSSFPNILPVHAVDARSIRVPSYTCALTDALAKRSMAPATFSSIFVQVVCTMAYVHARGEPAGKAWVLVDARHPDSQVTYGVGSSVAYRVRTSTVIPAPLFPGNSLADHPYCELALMLRTFASFAPDHRTGVAISSLAREASRRRCDAATLLGLPVVAPLMRLMRGVEAGRVASGDAGVVQVLPPGYRGSASMWTAPKHCSRHGRFVERSVGALRDAKRSVAKTAKAFGLESSPLHVLRGLHEIMGLA